MCIGVPMQVVSGGDGYALCAGPDGEQRISTLLVGDQASGAWLLTFLGSAREVLSPESAARINDALQALEQVSRGNTDIDHLFADLIDREPTLPAFLRPPETSTDA